MSRKLAATLQPLGDFDGIVRLDGRTVTVNPFGLSRALRGWLDCYVAALRDGQRDQRAFCHTLRVLFEPEVQLAREEPHPYR